MAIANGHPRKTRTTKSSYGDPADNDPGEVYSGNSTHKNRSEAGETSQSTEVTKEGDFTMPKGSETESNLDKEVERMTSGHSAYTATDKIDLREHLRVQLLYPGEHVLFRDHYEGEGSSIYLARREVLCHSLHREVVYSHYDTLSAENRTGVHIEYVAPRAGKQRSR
jgi:hypothetical protein